MDQEKQHALIRLKSSLWKGAIKLGWTPRRHNFLMRKNDKGKLIRLSFRMDDKVRLQEKIPLTKKEQDEGVTQPNFKLLKEVEYDCVEIEEFTINSKEKKEEKKEKKKKGDN